MRARVFECVYRKARPCVFECVCVSLERDGSPRRVNKLRPSLTQGRHGRAFLFSNVVNITLGAKEDRNLITGLHTVADVYCNSCQTILGAYVPAVVLPACTVERNQSKQTSWHPNDRLEVCGGL